MVALRFAEDYSWEMGWGWGVAKTNRGNCVATVSQNGGQHEMDTRSQQKYNIYIHILCIYIFILPYHEYIA